MQYRKIDKSVPGTMWPMKLMTLLALTTFYQHNCKHWYSNSTIFLLSLQPPVMVFRHDLSQYTGQQSSTEWPPKSPDIMLLDMLLWGVYGGRYMQW